MTNRESFLQIWGMEAPVTQRFLAAVPDANLAYRPDPKSRTAVELTAFVAGHAPILAALLQTGEVKGAPSAAPRSIKEAAGVFAAVLPQVDKALKSVDDATWDKKIGNIYGPDGSVFLSGPVGSLAWATLFDLIHHRGQLSTYLRPMGGKVPSIYGPSADDPGKM
jgi:uncharacterized damage-inducible protein DinB